MPLTWMTASFESSPGLDSGAPVGMSGAGSSGGTISGASFSITDSSIVLQLSNQILSMARAAGVDCIATACPLCQLNLDMRQKDIEARYERRYNLPVFYFTQLLGLAMGCTASEVSLDSLVVAPYGLLESKGICGAEARR